MRRLAHILPPFLPTAIVVIAILYLTLAPDPLPDTETPSFLGEHADKIVHGIMMFGLTFTLVYDCRRHFVSLHSALPLKFLLTVGVTVTFFSILDEWAQSAMQMGRHGDIYDLLADIAGIVAALLLSYILKNLMRKSFDRNTGR